MKQMVMDMKLAYLRHMGTTLQDIPRRVQQQEASHQVQRQDSSNQLQQQEASHQVQQQSTSTTFLLPGTPFQSQPSDEDFLFSTRPL